MGNVAGFVRAAAGLVLAVAVVSLALPAGALATHYPRSQAVALVPDEGSSSSGGVLPTSGTVQGRPDESFDQFTFTNLDIASISPANLAQYDTVVLNQVDTSDLDGSARQALSSFVTSGGKLIIHDSDGTDGNNYLWLPAPAQSGQSCKDCGNTTGTAQVIENNTLVSANPSDPSYVAVSELQDVTDAIGDANVMVSQDPRWFKDALATNGLGQQGAVHSYASVTGLMIYNGFDTDYMSSTEASGVDWLAQMWYAELAQPWDPDGLPHTTPIACSAAIGSVSPSSVTVPEAGNPGTTVTITGQAFCPGTKVQFGNTAAVVTATVLNNTTLTATVPRTATGGGLQLITPDGTRGPTTTLPVDSYRNVNGFAFSNYFGVRKDFGLDDVTSMFGDKAFDTVQICLLTCQTVRVPTGAANAVEKIGATFDGLCFAFAYGSLRLSQGIDRAYDPSHGRSAIQWTSGDTWDLLRYYTYDMSGIPLNVDDGTYGMQMHRYLDSRQLGQLSAEYANAVNTYSKGLRKGTNKGTYVLSAVRTAISRGKALIGLTYRYHDSSKWPFLFGKNATEGHELVAYDVETHGGGSFDIDVYDGNQPWSDAELTDASKHTSMLGHSQIHVKADGSWTYSGDFGGKAGSNWSGGPDELQPVAFDAVRGPLTPFVSGSGSNAVAVGAPVAQLTDSRGRHLFDSSGNLLSSDQRADAVLVGLADANTTTGGNAPPMLILDGGTPYTFALGPGTETIAGAGVLGQIRSGHGAAATIAPSAGQLEISQAKSGPVTLSLSRTVHRATISASAQSSGRALTLAVNRMVTVTAQAPQTIHLTISRRGQGGAPAALNVSVPLTKREAIVVNAGAATASAVPATIIDGHHHRHSVTLINRAPRPSVTITRVSVHRARGHTTFTITLQTQGAAGGTVIVTARVSRHTLSSKVAARPRLTVRFPVARLTHGARYRIWAAALNSTVQASGTARRNGLLR